VTFTGVLSRPDDVTNFRISVLGDTASLSWNAILGQAVAYYVVRHTPATSGAAWGSASVLFERLTTNAVQTAALNGTYLVKAFTFEGTESANPALIIFTGQAIVSLNVVETITQPTWFGLPSNITINLDDRLHLDADDVEGEFLFHDKIDLGETYTSRVSATVLAFGDDPTNVMASWETLLEVDNLSGATPADWRVLLEERHIEYATPIDTSLGTNIGNMTSSGGLAAAFDLDTTQTAAQSAVRTASTTAYVGKTLAAPASITHAVVWASSDAGFFFTSLGNNIRLYGKTGSAPANATDGTLLAEVVDITDQNLTHGVLLVSDDPVTAWDHVWVRLQQTDAQDLRVAELQIWEGDGVVAWTDWAELRLSDITAQAYEFRLTLTSLNPAIDVLVEEVNISVDMPDRVLALGDLAIANTGTTITFDEPFWHLETVVVTAIQDAGSGDYAVISNRTEEGFDIIVKNSANVGVNRTVDAVAAGYGRRIV
jgi:hypothetical protein